MANLENIKAYPVYLKKSSNSYAVWNDTIPFASQGETLEEALYMAKDAIELMAYDAFCNGEEFVDPIDADRCDDVYDIKNYVVCDLNRYFRLESEKKVKKNCTIPESLAKAAESQGLNFSKILTYGIERELNLV